MKYRVSLELGGQDIFLYEWNKNDFQVYHFANKLKI